MTSSPPLRLPTLSQANAGNREIKVVVYLYFFFLVFEGGLRKWVLPGLSAPLLIVRDPIALLAILMYLNQKRELLNFYTLPMLLIGALSFLFTLGFGHGNLAVAIFGFRTLILHYVFLFIIGDVFSKSDVVRMGNWLLYILPPLTLLIGLQYFSPQSTWVNRGIGGDVDGAGFSGAMGYFRPSGTFSFTTGLTTCYSLAAAFVVAFWSEPQHAKKLPLLVGTVCIFLAIPLSISRGYLFQLLLTVAFFGVASIRNGRSFRLFLIAVIVAPVLLLMLSTIGFVQTSLQALTTRFTLAAQSEGGLEGTLGDRLLGGLFRSVTDFEGTPWYGYGLGMGTNVGSQLLTGGRKFLLSEGEWGRITGEMGPVFGLPIILLRCALAAQLFFASIPRLFRGNALPFILLSFGLVQITITSWSQPTSLGFYAFTVGLIIASLKDDTYGHTTQ